MSKSIVSNKISNKIVAVTIVSLLAAGIVFIASAKDALCEWQHSGFLEDYTNDKLDNLSKRFSLLSNTDQIEIHVDAAINAVQEFKKQPTDESIDLATHSIGLACKEVDNYLKHSSEILSIPDELLELSKKIALQRGQVAYEEEGDYSSYKDFLAEQSSVVAQMGEEFGEVIEGLHRFYSEDLLALIRILDGTLVINSTISRSFGSSSPGEVMAKMHGLLTKMQDFRGRIRDMIATLTEITTPIYKENYRKCKLVLDSISNT